ncbi:type I-E CRISPR-associated protein Cas5/CasD [Streptomyces sp. ISL-99]|uniref:type I-E CRISPR-associated protein Cas5/CasD n=1 Tax=Streptomyces sp. ISL-99 TaxID=2819193 RepID=UPI001BE741A2|nr:type I-E CRISPR-associated protein Cas5/CasD [Streptomyces sp. ISL-99]MBT2526314.1 type I-E CRISPR-associated protein Cas5/CasD [Streptomyces sp. ISL-99]
MNNGFLLQLGGPLQSWGEHSAFNDRDTMAYPTRSGLIGMLASARGIPRAEAVDGPPDSTPTAFASLRALRFTVRVDRPGTRLRDFHTVGGGYPAHRTLPTAKGGRRKAEAATLVSHRHYLADAFFTVAVTAAPGAADDLLATCAEALAHPRWPLHMGRRSCPPGASLLLRAESADPLAELCAVPLARKLPAGTRGGPTATSPAAQVSVGFVSDTPFPSNGSWGSGSSSVSTTLNDEPVRLTARDRIHRARPVYTAHRMLPAQNCKGYGAAYLRALDEYLNPASPDLPVTPVMPVMPEGKRS